MATYIFQGVCRSPGYAEIVSENRAEALLRAKKGDFDSIHVEDEPIGFTVGDDDWPELDTNNDDALPDPEERCYSCDKLFIDELDAVELECGHGWCHRGECLNDHIGGCGLCPIGLGD